MRLNVLGSVLLALMLSVAAQAQISGDVVRIGVLTDMAGVTSADITGKGSLVAAEMAVREIDSKVLGKPVEFIGGSTGTRQMSVRRSLAAGSMSKASIRSWTCRIQASRLGSRRCARSGSSSSRDAGTTALTNEQALAFRLSLDL